MPRFTITNAFVASRRLSGSVVADSETEAMRKFAAREARKLGVSVLDAISNVIRKGGYTIQIQEQPPSNQEADKFLRAPDDYSDWPSMNRPK